MLLWALAASTASLVTPLAAQQRQLTADATLQKDPNGVVLAEIPAGAPVLPGRTRDEWREATLEGWIFTASTERTTREGFDLVVSVDDGENLRATPNGEIIARLRTGALLHRVRVRGGWTQVRRTGWIERSKLPAPVARRTPAAADTGRSASMGGNAPAAQQPAPTGPAAAPVRPAPPEPGGDRVEAARETPLYATPDSQRIGILQDGALGRVVTRAGEWVRVQFDGWVRESDLRPAAASAPTEVTGAELKANPEKYVGATVDWRVQVIAVQIADELRSEMPQGQPYLLTRGPLPEPGFVYVMIPQDQVDRFRALPPLQELVLRVVIRAPRTRYLATPVVELAEVRSGMSLQ